MPAPSRRPDLRLRELRESTGVSMKDFAQKAGCNYHYMGQIERGVRRPSPIMARRFADVLSELTGRKVKVEAFFTRRELRNRRAA